MFRYLGAVLLSILLLPGESARAAEVLPLLIEFEAGQQQSSVQAIRVRSTEPDAMAIEIKVIERIFDDEGIQRLEARDDEFLIFPSQVILEPLATQVFRFQYLGDLPAASRNFYFNVRQIPINLSEQMSQVNVVVEFAASVNLLPPAGTSEVTIISAVESMGEDGNREIVFLAANAGNLHTYLSGSEIQITRPDGSVERIDGQEMKRRFGDTLVPALGKREFRFTVEDDAPRGEWGLRLGS